MNQSTLNIIFLSLPYLQQGDSSKRSFHTLFYYVYIKWGMRDSLRYMFLVFIRPRDAHVLVTAAVTFDISNYPAKHSIMKVEYHFIILMSLTLKRKNKLHAILCSRRTFVEIKLFWIEWMFNWVCRASVTHVGDSQAHQSHRINAVVAYFIPLSMCGLWGS